MRAVFFIIVTFFFCKPMHAQQDDAMRHENMKFYISYVQDYISTMKENTDSVRVLELLDQMQLLTEQINFELNKVVLPKETAEDFKPVEIDDEYVWEGDISYEKSDKKGQDQQEKPSGGTFMPFQKKWSTNVEIQFGINNLLKESTAAGFPEPDIHTGKSWFWDFGLVRKSRLGGSQSRVALTYGLSYLLNRFTIDNDLILQSGTSAFTTAEGLQRSPGIHIGYLNIPLGADIRLSKNVHMGVGGYGGYRVYTAQHLERKISGEAIEESRRANYGLNNWMYGVSFRLGIKGFHLTGRYHLSNLFRTTENYNYHIFMLGTRILLF